MSLRFAHFHPGGMSDNSPTLQRWDLTHEPFSPEGTAEKTGQPSLRDVSGHLLNPNAEALGYCQMSLQDQQDAGATGGPRMHRRLKERGYL
jgi:hypothetical protein